MKNRSLCIGGTHGDEPIGVNVLTQLEKRIGGFDWIIGSPPAFKAGTREYEGDLNRSAPGDPEASTYASRRAAEVIRLSQQYRYTIDIHGTNAYTGIFVIITNPTRANLELALRLDIKRVVLWPSFSAELQGPLSEYVPCGLEIECGPKDMPVIQTRLTDILERFLRNQYKELDEEAEKIALSQKECFEVYGSLDAPDLRETFEEFKPVTLEQETFFPLLIGRYQKRNGITCYKLRRIDPLQRYLLPC